MSVEPLYEAPKPKILLINFDAVDSEDLKNKGFHIERGWASGGSHHFPSPGYEYDIIIARLDKQGYDLSRGLSQYGSSDNDDLDNIEQTIKAAGFALVFTGDESTGLGDLAAVGITDIELTSLDERDKQYNAAEELPQSSLLPGYNFSLNILKRIKGDIELPVPVGLKWRQNESTPIFTLAHNAAAQHISAIAYRREQQWNPEKGNYDNSFHLRYVVFPPIKKGHGRIAGEFLSYLPQIRPELFPTDEKYGWLQNKAYWSDEMISAEEEISAVQARYEAELEDARASYSDAQERDQWMRGLLIADDTEEFPEGEKLTDVTKKALEFLEFIVENKEKDNSTGKRREDLLCRDGAFIAYVECKGVVGQNAAESHVSQLLNHLLAAKGERGILIINHDRKRDPSSRSLPYDDAPHVLTSEHITILPTYTLFRILRSVQAGALTKESAREMIKKSGRVEFH